MAQQMRLAAATWKPVPNGCLTGQGRQALGKVTGVLHTPSYLRKRFVFSAFVADTEP